MLKRLLVLVAALGASACHHAPDREAAEARSTLESWQATLELMEQERGRHHLPERFAAQIASAADHERAKAVAQLRKATR
jgi:hypothetical protein